MVANLKEWTEAIDAVEAVLANRSLNGRSRTTAIIDAIRVLNWKSPSEVRDEVSDAMDEG